MHYRQGDDPLRSTPRRPRCGAHVARPFGITQTLCRLFLLRPGDLGRLLCVRRP